MQKTNQVGQRSSSLAIEREAKAEMGRERESIYGTTQGREGEREGEGKARSSQRPVLGRHAPDPLPPGLHLLLPAEPHVLGQAPPLPHELLLRVGHLLALLALALTLTGANSYTGATTITGGRLALDFTGTGGPASDIISSASHLMLSGGALAVLGAAGEGDRERPAEGAGRESCAG